LFSPIRQGPVETGVAVLACDPVVLETPTAELTNADNAEAGGAPLTQQDDVGTTTTPTEADAINSAPEPLLPVPGSRFPTVDRPKPVVLTARYRHTLKGADRGKWALEIFEQADAPLATLEKVIQGVQMRLDEAVEPERLTADALRAALAEGLWTPPAR
jgi:hypothetical protein